jgi:hypothetical protein
MQTTEKEQTLMSFQVGDRVTPIADERVPAETLGRVFVVRKVNPKNLKCEAEDGGRGINFPAELLAPATDENIAAGRSSFGVPYTPRELFANGQVVTLANPYKDITTDTPLVVSKDDGGRMVNVVKLGGDGARYLRMGPSNLVKRDLTWLTEELMNRA